MTDRTPTTLATQVTNTTIPVSWGNGLKTWVDFLKSMDACRVYNSAAISVSNTTTTALTFNSERYDNNALHSTASQTSRITCQTPGLYRIGGCAEYAANSTNTRQLIIRLNGSTVIAKITLAAVAVDQPLTISTDYRLAAGDYVELCAYQNSGGSLNVQASGSYSPEFWAAQVGL